MPDEPLYVSYTLSSDTTLPQGTFRWTVTVPPGETRVFTCAMLDARGNELGSVTAGGSHGTPFATSPAVSWGVGTATTLTAHVWSGLAPNPAETIIPLVFSTRVALALDQKVIAFTWSPQGTGAGVGGRPLAELDPYGSPVVLSYDVPEPTSYRGRHFIDLGIPADYFNGPASLAGKAGSGGTPTGMLGDGAGTPGKDVWSVPAERAEPAQLNEARITSAFGVAKATGYFDPSVFPNVQAGNDAATREGAIQALEGLDAATVVTQLGAGNRLVVYRDTSGRFTFRFIPVPRAAVPSLLLVEYYRLSSYPARYGAGRTIKTFSLLPGERTRIRVNSYKRTTETAMRSASILDSTNDETESEFEQTVQGEQSRQEGTSRAFEYHADAQAEAKASWGWGSASAAVSGGVKGSSNATREEFAKNVATAVAQHAARASSRRDMQVDTSLDVKAEAGEEQAVERELENVNVSRTLNFVFRQMNQEFVTVLHLVDVRVAFFDGFAESRVEVPLPELDKLLKTYVVDARRPAVRDAIAGELQAITDYTGTVRADFIESTALTGAGTVAADTATSGSGVKADAKAGTKADAKAGPGAGPVTTEYLRVNTKAVTVHGDRATGPVIKVPGVIMSADSHVMRTDGVVVDTFIGLGNGLDDYSVGLQQQEVRSRQLDNDLRQAELDRVKLGISLVQSGNTEAVKLYRQVFPTPQIVNQIDQAAINNPPDDVPGTSTYRTAP